MIRTRSVTTLVDESARKNAGCLRKRRLDNTEPGYLANLHSMLSAYLLGFRVCLAGSWGLMTTYAWACNVSYAWGTLNNSS